MPMPNWARVRDSDGYWLSGCKPIHPKDWELAAKVLGSSRASHLLSEGSGRLQIESSDYRELQDDFYWGNTDPIPSGHPTGTRASIVEQMCGEIFLPRQPMRYLSVDDLMQPKPHGIVQNTSSGALFRHIYRDIGLQHVP